MQDLDHAGESVQVNYGVLIVKLLVIAIPPP